MSAGPQFTLQRPAAWAEPQSRLIITLGSHTPCSAAVRDLSAIDCNNISPVLDAFLGGPIMQSFAWRCGQAAASERPGGEMGNANAGDRHVQGNTPDGGARASGALSRRDFVQTTAGFLSLAAAGGLLGACGSGSGSGSGDSSGGGDVTFGFSHPYAEVPVVANIKDLVKKLAERRGLEGPAGRDPGGQSAGPAQHARHVDHAATSPRSAPFPPTPPHSRRSARRADDAGIVWTTYGEPTARPAPAASCSRRISPAKSSGKGAVEWINANDPDAEVLILEAPTTRAVPPAHRHPDADDQGADGGEDRRGPAGAASRPRGCR